jgi:hypothetical protein
MASSDNKGIGTINFIDQEIHKLCPYFRLNKLSLRPDKNKYLLICPDNISNMHGPKFYFNRKNNNDNMDPNLIHELHPVANTDKIPAIKYLP